MSHAAQEVQRLVDEMRRSREKDRNRTKGVRVEHNDDTSTKEADMSAEKPAAVKRTRKTNGIAKATRTRATKTKTEWKAKRNTGDFPNPNELKLAADGISTSGDRRYFTLNFTNGFVVRLQDATAGYDDAIKVRDLMSAWLAKRVGGGA